MEVRLLSKEGAGCSGQSLAFCPLASLGESPCVCGVAWGLRVQPELLKELGWEGGWSCLLHDLVPIQAQPRSTCSPVCSCAGTARGWAEESCLWPPASQGESWGCLGLAKMLPSACWAQGAQHKLLQLNSRG